MARATSTEYGSFDPNQRAGVDEIDYGNNKVARKSSNGWNYDWIRPQAFQDVLGDNQVKGSEQEYAFRAAADKAGQPLDQASSSISDDPRFKQFQQTGQFNNNGFAAPQQPTSQPTMASWTGQAPSTPQPNPQRDELYNTLLGRSKQSLAIDPNTDPNLRPQIDTFRAEQTRAARNLQGDNAEANGPYANNTGYNRMLMEHAGQATGNFASSLMDRELQARRGEIEQALQSMGGMLSQDQQIALQQELAKLSATMQGRGQDIQASLGQGGLNNDLLRTMLQNQQFGRNLDSQNDQFVAQYGLNTTDRASYWDAVHRGLLN